MTLIPGGYEVMFASIFLSFYIAYTQMNRQCTVH